jgi:hypothetical protein
LVVGWWWKKKSHRVCFHHDEAKLKRRGKLEKVWSEKIISLVWRPMRWMDIYIVWNMLAKGLMMKLWVYTLRVNWEGFLFFCFISSTLNFTNCKSNMMHKKSPEPELKQKKKISTVRQLTLKWKSIVCDTSSKFNSLFLLFTSQFNSSSYRVNQKQKERKLVKNWFYVDED